MGRLPLFKAIRGIPAHNERKHPVSSFHEDFFKKQQRAQLRTSFTGKGLRGMMKERIVYAGDTSFLFVVTFPDRSRGFVTGCYSTRLSLLYAEMVSRVLLDHWTRDWEKGDLLRL